MRRLLFILPLLLAAESSPENNSLLLEAIHAGDTRAVRAALKSGADANTRDALGTTPLMHAGAYAPVECMRLLLPLGADANAASNAGFTPLMWSVSGPEKVRLPAVEGSGRESSIEGRQYGGHPCAPERFHRCRSTPAHGRSAGRGWHGYPRQALAANCPRPVAANTLHRNRTNAPGRREQADVRGRSPVRRHSGARLRATPRRRRPERACANPSAHHPAARLRGALRERLASTGAARSRSESECQGVARFDAAHGRRDGGLPERSSRRYAAEQGCRDRRA